MTGSGLGGPCWGNRNEDFQPNSTIHPWIDTVNLRTEPRTRPVHFKCLQNSVRSFEMSVRDLESQNSSDVNRHQPPPTQHSPLEFSIQMKDICPSEGLEFHFLPIPQCRSINPRRPLVPRPSLWSDRASPQLSVHEMAAVVYVRSFHEQVSGVRGRRVRRQTADRAAPGRCCLRQSDDDDDEGHTAHFPPG